MELTVVQKINIRLASRQYAGRLVDALEPRAQRAMEEAIGCAFTCDEDDFDQGRELAEAEEYSDTLDAQLRHARAKRDWEDRDFNFGA